MGQRKVTTRKKPGFRDLYEGSVFTTVAAVINDAGKWSLMGLHRNGEAAIFVEAARGGIREWSSLDHLADFCESMGIALWQVHRQRKTQPAKTIDI